jgi:hypothetical protein
VTLTQKYWFFICIDFAKINTFTAMKKTYTLLTTLIITGFAFTASAQNGFSELIKSGPADATKLANAYAEPLFKGFGVGMNSGWTNTAKTKSLGHFDVRISATAAFVPSKDKTFDVTQVGLSNNLRVKAGSPNTTPTVGGGSSGRATMEVFNSNGQKVDEFTMPEGQSSVIPAPQLQVTVGLIKNTDLTLRGMPSVNLGDDIGKVSMIGFGIKHNIIQDFTGAAGKIIPFDLALAVGYTRLNLDVPLDVQADGALPFGAQNSDFSNQHVEGHFNNWNVQAIVSKKIAVFTPFLSVGYNTAKTNVQMIGNYPITTSATGGQEFYQTYTNPITIKEKSLSALRADLGFQLDLSFFKFYASGSLAEYKSVTAGIGFGF